MRRTSRATLREMTCGFLGPESYTLLFLCCQTYSVIKKIPPDFFRTFFRKRLGIFSQNFTHLVYVPIYAGLRIFIPLPAALTKLCHIKRDHHYVLKMSTIG